jgi:SAM-dependent methyltransferase
MSDSFEPFDRALRRLRRNRAADRFADFAFLKDAMADELLARLDAVGRRFAVALDLGCHDGRLGRQLPADRVAYADAGRRFAASTGGVQCDEDRLPFADGTFDLIVSAGSLHGVNDLPGAFIQVRRALKPGGLFLASFVGGDSLAELRRAFLQAESEVTGGAAARVLPMVDPTEAPALLQRAGFAMPVAEVDARRVRYADLFGAVRDLRGSGEASILPAATRAPLRRDALLRAAERFAGEADPDGRVPVTLTLLTLTAWAPGDAGDLGDALKQRL